MPQFDATTFSPQLFWLVVTFAVLFVAMWRYALPRLSSILEARQGRIDGDLEKAATIKEEADQVLAAYEKALAAARGEATAAIKQSSDRMSAASAERHEILGKDLAERARGAEQRIAAAKDEALASIKVVAAATARAATAKLIGVELPGDQVRDAVEGAMRRRG